MSKGKIVQIIGPVIDVEFPEDSVPSIYNALRVQNEELRVKNGKNNSELITHNSELVLEVQQHLGDGIIRAVAMSSTDGLQRGMEVIDSGAPISVPVGEAVLGRLFNVLGQTVDEKGQLKSGKTLPIHRNPPSFEEQSTETEVFETGIKVIDLLAPFVKGGKVGLFGGAGVGKTVLIQ